MKSGEVESRDAVKINGKGGCCVLGSTLYDQSPCIFWSSPQGDRLHFLYADGSESDEMEAIASKCLSGL